MYLLQHRNRTGDCSILAAFTEKAAAESAQKRIWEIGKDLAIVHYNGEAISLDTLCVVYVREWQEALLTSYKG